MIKTEIKYKKTGVDWMPEIPEHWDYRRLKNFAEIGTGQDQKGIENDNGKYSIYGTGGLMGKTNEFLYEGPSVILGRKGTIDNPFYVTEPFWTVDTAYYTKIKENVDPRFFFYCCLTIQFDYYKYGSAVPSMSQRDLNQIRLPYPPLNEQKSIADYLDAKCEKITRFIQAKQRFIELLKEQRQSIITQAVTKGIDDGVKMKETGIGWMPEVPEHWEVRRLKNLVELYKHNKTQTNSNGSDFKLALENIDNWTGKYLESVSPDFEGEGRFFKKGDVLFGKLRPYLAKAFLPDKDGICVSEILVFTPNSELVTNEFLFQRILTKGFIDIVNGSTYGAKMPRASWDFIGNMRIAYPPTIEEQKRIVEYIKAETRTLDIAIGKAEREIELIKEYREALIAEAVTGKMKV